MCRNEGHSGCSLRTGWWVVGAPSWVRGYCQEAVTVVQEEMVGAGRRVAAAEMGRRSGQIRAIFRRIW